MFTHNEFPGIGLGMTTMSPSRSVANWTASWGSFVGREAAGVGDQGGQRSALPFTSTLVCCRVNCHRMRRAKRCESLDEAELLQASEKSWVDCCCGASPVGHEHSALRVLRPILA